MKKIRKLSKPLIQIIITILVLVVWLYSGYKILNYLKLNKIVGATCEIGCPPTPPPPPPPPTPPCPPPGCCPTPTPSPLPSPTPTSPPEATPTPTPEVSPSPTPEVSPTPTLPPGGGVGGPPQGGAGGPFVCGASTPGVPTLLSATKTGSKANLSWTSVSGITNYALSYGLSSGNYIYGVSNTGNTTSFTVSDLDPGKDYCFAIRAVNDCMPGGLSNEICTGKVLGVGQVLGLSTTSSGTNSFVDTLLMLGSLCLLLATKSFLAEKRLI